LYPEHAIKKKLEDLELAQKDFNAFMKKIIGAFQISPKQVKENGKHKPT
jgi:hypothetical protein